MSKFDSGSESLSELRNNIFLSRTPGNAKIIQAESKRVILRQNSD